MPKSARDTTGFGIKGAIDGEVGGVYVEVMVQASLKAKLVKTKPPPTATMNVQQTNTSLTFY